MYKLAIFLFALAALCLHCEAKIFKRCDLVRELRRQRFPERELRDWVCLIERESGSNTAIVSNGMWGLFQISQYYWCNTGNSPGKACNVKCADLITDDITKASTCAKLIKDRQSFTAWTKWRLECNGKPENLPNISNC